MGVTDGEHRANGTPPRRWASRAAVPAVLAALVLGQTWLFRDATCETFDEPTYLRLGIRIFRYGDFSCLSSPMAPPLPILLEYALPSVRAARIPDDPDWAWEIPRLVRMARLSTALLIGVPLVWSIYCWLALRRGWPAGAAGAGLVALSPTVVAAASLATTDACFALFAVAGLSAFHRFVTHPSRATFLLAGAGLGLALAAKQSAVLFGPLALVELVLKNAGRRPGATLVDDGLRLAFRVGAGLAGLAAVAFAVDWTCHGFGLGPTFRSGNAHAYLPVIVPMAADLFPNGEAIHEAARRLRPPLPIDTLVGQIDHASVGHPAFFMGEHSYQGWWSFFPVALAIKSTPAELIVFAAAASVALRRSSWRDPARRLWMVAFGSLLGLGLASKLNIGQRYMLFLYPLAALLAADRLGEILAAGGRRARPAACFAAVLLAWQAWSAASIAPHYLSYFNSFCGGPMQGYRYLVDSSLDWGQDLPALRKALEARGYHRVAVGYFGTGNGDVQGIRSKDWMSPGDLREAGCDWLAISATVYQGAYGGVNGFSERFETLPSARAGYSIFLYDLRDPKVYDAIREFRAYDNPPAPPEPSPDSAAF